MCMCVYTNAPFGSFLCCKLYYGTSCSFTWQLSYMVVIFFKLPKRQHIGLSFDTFGALVFKACNRVRLCSFFWVRRNWLSQLHVSETSLWLHVDLLGYLSFSTSSTLMVFTSFTLSFVARLMSVQLCHWEWQLSLLCMDIAFIAQVMSYSGNVINVSVWLVHFSDFVAQQNRSTYSQRLMTLALNSSSQILCVYLLCI